jgi:hypothetical protein
MPSTNAISSSGAFVTAGSSVKPETAGVGTRGGLQRAQDAVLARDVVGRRQQRADRRAAQDPPRARGVGHEVRQL